MRDAIVEMVREVGTVRETFVSPSTWASWLSCGLVKPDPIPRDFAEEQLEKEVIVFFYCN
jgi:hypothetical protein